MKRWAFLFAVLLLAATAGAQIPLAQEPLTWHDNNEATDGINCGGLCSGTGFLPPVYELHLNTQTWGTAGQPPCVFHLPYWTVGTPTAAGLTAAVNDVESCRTVTLPSQACTTIDVPPALYAYAQGLVDRKSVV